MGVDCSGANDFGPSVGLVSPNPANGVPDELLNENIDAVDPFRSEPMVAELGSIVLVEGVWTSVDSGTGLSDGKPPNRLGGG